jgi:hypothetical protein
MFEEFPKCIYATGNYDGEYLIVFSAEEQAKAAENGVYPLGEAPKKRKSAALTDGTDQLQ